MMRGPTPVHTNVHMMHCDTVAPVRVANDVGNRLQRERSPRPTAVCVVPVLRCKRLMRVRPYVGVSVCLALALYMPIAPTARAQSTQSLRVRTLQSPASVPAARVHHRGLPNFGIVSPRLYRGGQPEDAGFAELRNLGVDIVVNLRHETDQISRERALVEVPEARVELVQVLQDALDDLSGNPSPIEVRFFGPDQAVLERLARAAGEKIEHLPEL